MKLAILGASRGTGAEVVKAALARGHEVTAFARTPETLAVSHPKLIKLPGDFHRAESVGGAVRGQDAVVITASSTSLKGFRENPRYFSKGTEYAIAAMKAQGVSRLVVLSALGVGESRRLANFLLEKLVISFLLKLPFEDHERQEALVRASGLDWVIVRPGRLTDGPARKHYVTKTAVEPVPSSISRADLADFLVTAAEADTWVGHAVQIGG
ncbi:MAG: SDR family oxidoreductase [Myxococcales bacterium]|nr:SDR family oxidoreductase [Myxococcales bacterium]